MTNEDVQLVNSFMVTYKPDSPRGCKAYGFRSATWPSLVVLRESGEPCTLFEKRQDASRATKPRRDRT